MYGSIILEPMLCSSTWSLSRGSSIVFFGALVAILASPLSFMTLVALLRMLVLVGLPFSDISVDDVGESLVVIGEKQIMAGTYSEREHL